MSANNLVFHTKKTAEKCLTLYQQQKMELTQEQKQIIESTTGPLLIFAPAGTGKTSIMALRAQRALDEGIAPERILCITFTNRAAREIRYRMRQRQVEKLDTLMVSTIHSLCAFMLRSYSKSLGIPKNFLIADEVDTEEILRIAIDRATKNAYVRTTDAVFQHAAELIACKANIHPDDLKLIPYPPLVNASYYWCPPETTAFLETGKTRVRKLLAQILEEYHRLLRESMLLDFGDLIYYTRSLLHHDPEFREYWEHFFGWIQVDEVQDITQAEFEILVALARRHQNLALFGDPDQTIYEWRGSSPFKVIEQFKQTFPKYREFQLTWNFRSTKQLIAAADAVARNFQQRYTRLRAAHHLPEGKPPLIHSLNTASQEALWIGALIQHILNENPQASIAVLTRTNAYAEALAPLLESQGLKPVLATRLAKFRSPVAKYVTALLRLLVNPYDQFAARTLLQSYGHQLLEENNSLKPLLAADIQPSNFLYDRLIESPSLFQQFFNALAENRVFVIDIETTSLQPHTAEIVEIALLQIDAQLRIRKHFHRYVLPDQLPKSKYTTHGLTSRFLEQYGHDKEQVLLELLHFVAPQPFFVGYNVMFDLNILRKELEHHRLSHITFPALDLLPIVQQQFDLERYSLQHVAEHLSLSPYPTHTAIADAKTIVALLHLLLPIIESLAQQDLLASLPPQLQHFCRMAAGKLSEWREISTTYPLQQLLQLIFSTKTFPGIVPIVRDPSVFLPVADALLNLAKDLDQQVPNPFLRLQHFLGSLALSRSIDDYRSQGNCLLTTVHQSKGMEFDVVFLAGANAQEFPKIVFADERNIDRIIEEEKRLFYVAVTRAKRALLITWAQQDFSYHRNLGGSPFLNFLL